MFDETIEKEKKELEQKVSTTEAKIDELEDVQSEVDFGLKVLPKDHPKYCSDPCTLMGLYSS